MTQSWLLRAVPALFVFLWSTGFIGAKYGMSNAEPLTFLAVRFFIAFALMALLISLLQSKWPRRIIQYCHLAVVGFLVHCLYLGGVFVAIYHGLPAGISAIIVSIHPLLTAFIAANYLTEKISKVNYIGLALGFIGIVLVIGSSQLLSDNASLFGVSLCFASLIGISIGTLYQKKFCGEIELLSGTSVQYLAAMIFIAAPALFLEDNIIVWSVDVVGALIWLVIALSIIAVLLLMLMIKNGEANRVASLFYLVPALTSLEAWFLFDETLSIRAICGMILCMIGVYLARMQSTTAKT